MIKAFIMVGTSPLPCYISAIYISHYYVGSKVSYYFIYSKGNDDKYQQSTKDIAKNIEKEFRKYLKSYNQDNEIELLDIEDVNDLNEIKKGFEKHLNDDVSEIHLNFTGGTKTMSTFAYHYLKTNHENKSIFSYLDSRSHQMVVYDSFSSSINDQVVAHSLGGDLRKDKRFKVDLDTIARLHGSGVTYNDEDISNNIKYDKEYDKGYEEVLEKMIELFRRDKAKVTGDFLELIKFLFPAGGSLMNLSFEESKEEKEEGKEEGKKVKEIKGIRGHFKKLDHPKQEPLGSKKKEKLLTFIDGKWFEYYFFRELVKMRGDDDSVDLYFEVKRKEVEFEIDIIAIYGYQLCGISLTTDKSIRICKQKAFEVIHRARQLGGEETKVILATFLPGADDKENNVDILRNDMWMFEGNLLSKSHTYGIEDFDEMNILNEERYFENIIEKIKE